MRILLRRLGTFLLFALVALCFAPTLVPPFLDRVYHDGPASDHFDGERFFNPGFPPYAGAPQRFFNRWVTSSDRSEWPDHVPVRQTVPPSRVAGEPMLATWIGHATMLVQTRGLNILTDPIWSERASPFSFAGPKRVRAPGVRFEDLPRIDLVLISHNHYDHLDLATLKRLWRRDRPLIVTSLGNDAILRRAGIESEAFDWGEGTPIPCRWSAPPGAQYRTYRHPCSVVVERNHHWSSRWGTDRNRALWSAFTVRLPDGNLFFAGDTGWGDGGWAAEAKRRGPVRLALLPIGAYEPRDVMRSNHVNPEEAVALFERLDPGAAIGIHWGTFQLTFEPIDEPRQRLEALKRARRIAPRRFVAIEAGASFSVPPLRPVPSRSEPRALRPLP